MKKHLLFIITFLYCWQLTAGWDITYRLSDADGMMSYDVMLIEDNLLKYKGNDMSFILDTESKIISFIIDESQSYWKGSAKDFREGMNDSMKAYMDEMLAEIPEDQRAMYVEMLGSMTDMYSTPTKADIENVNIKIVDSNEPSEIAGYQTEKFQIFVDEQLKETLWIANDKRLMEDFNAKTAQNLMIQLKPNLDNEFLYEYTKTYLNLLADGFLMKSIDNEGDTTEVIKVLERSISDEEISVPNDYSLVSLEELMQMMMMGNNDENDSDGW